MAGRQGRQVDQPRGPVPRSRGEPSTVGREGQGEHGIVVAAQRARLGRSPPAEETHRPVPGARRDRTTIRRECDGQRQLRPRRSAEDASSRRARDARRRPRRGCRRGPELPHVPRAAPGSTDDGRAVGHEGQRGRTVSRLRRQLADQGAGGDVPDRHRPRLAADREGATVEAERCRRAREVRLHLALGRRPHLAQEGAARHPPQHSRTLLSPDADASAALSGENAIDVTSLVCPWRRIVSRRSSARSRREMARPTTTASQRPSGLQARISEPGATGTSTVTSGGRAPARSPARSSASRQMGSQASHKVLRSGASRCRVLAPRSARLEEVARLRGGRPGLGVRLRPRVDAGDEPPRLLVAAQRDQRRHHEIRARRARAQGVGLLEHAHRAIELPLGEQGRHACALHLRRLAALVWGGSHARDLHSGRPRRLGATGEQRADCRERRGEPHQTRTVRPTRPRDARARGLHRRTINWGRRSAAACRLGSLPRGPEVPRSCGAAKASEEVGAARRLP